MEYYSEINKKPPHNPAIPLLGIYLDKTFIEKDTCTPMFIAALLTIAKTCKQSKCQPSRGLDKEVAYAYNGILLSHKK